MTGQLVVDVERGADRLRYRDAVYAQVFGFRPLMLDLVVPSTPGAAPVVLYLHGGGFASGTHMTSRNRLGREVTETLIANGIAVASVGIHHSYMGGGRLRLSEQSMRRTRTGRCG